MLGIVRKDPAALKSRRADGSPWGQTSGSETRSDTPDKSFESVYHESL